MYSHLILNCNILQNSVLPVPKSPHPGTQLAYGFGYHRVIINAGMEPGCQMPEDEVPRLITAPHEWGLEPDFIRCSFVAGCFSARWVQISDPRERGVRRDKSLPQYQEVGSNRLDAVMSQVGSNHHVFMCIVTF